MESSAEGYWPDCREKGEDELVTAAVGANEFISLVLGDNRPPADDLRNIVVDSSGQAHGEVARGGTERRSEWLNFL